MVVSGLWIDYQTATHQGFVASAVIFLFKLARDAHIVLLEQESIPFPGADASKIFYFFA
jgi:hypothetical protein